MTRVSTMQLRARLAGQLSNQYGTEVPAYNRLVEVSHAVRSDVLAGRGEDPNTSAQSST